MKYEEEFIVDWCDGTTGNYFLDAEREIEGRERAFNTIFRHVMSYIEPGQRFKITVKIEPHDDWVITTC